ncbi:type II secretion system F family protein [[Pseudopropionibacterium] massiliense]|uniref:type II secretion system F family protein n=1 Tax=[Pseudopropionibacterium] massiliense TaxID=2220000 RepID=UPI00102F6240|nr:type II secretion system F family protein [[Pseudopropionibacterium] massiliense]
MSTAVLIGFLVAAAVLAWWAPPPLSRLEPRPSPLPGWVGKACDWAAKRWSGRRKADRAVVRELPETLDLLAVCLEAGAPMINAITTVAEISPAATAAILHGVHAQLQVGRDPQDAWGSLADHPDWGPPARDAARSARSGTSLVECLRVHADEARRRRREQETKRARSVGVKSVQPLALCFLPAFVLIGVVPLVASLLGTFTGR